MSYRPLLLTAFLALWLGFAVVPANARVESRALYFSFQCNGANQHLLLLAPELEPQGVAFILGAHIAVFENRGGLQYIILRSGDNPKRQIVTLGANETSAQIIMPGLTTILPSGTTTPLFFLAPTGGGGDAPFTIDGACSTGFGQVQGHATVYFVLP